jgi:dsRNA-specific ribonuclease
MHAISDTESRVARIRKLQDKIFSILGSVIDESHINALLDETALTKYWERVFTHKSVDADPLKNYDTFEFYGDKVMNDTFSDVIRMRFGDKINQEKGTLLMNTYMSKRFQPVIADKLGLPEFVRYDPEYPEVTKKVKEDIVEAFFGCLKIICDDRIHMGMGYVYCFNLNNHIFKDIPIVLDDIQKDPITLLKERFEKLRWGEPQYTYKNSDDLSLGNTKVEIRDSRTGTLLGTGYGTKDVAEADAAQNALRKIEGEGCTLEYADKYRLEQKLKRDPEFEKQYRRVEAAIVKLNNAAQRSGKVVIEKFKIQAVESHRVAKGQRFTFAIQVAYKGPDDKLNWKILSQKTGDNQDATKVQLMKELADMYHIPNDI